MTNAGPIGRPVARKEDMRLLRGRACFVDDLHLDRMLHGVFVRSPHPHAEIGAIDPSAALAAGARMVLTADDLPFADLGFVVRYWHAAIRGGTQSFLARGRVRYVGEPVALAVADDPYRAEDLGFGLVEVDYRPLESGRRDRGGDGGRCACPPRYLDPQRRRPVLLRARRRGRRARTVGAARHPRDPLRAAGSAAVGDPRRGGRFRPGARDADRPALHPGALQRPRKPRLSARPARERGSG